MSYAEHGSRVFQTSRLNDTPVLRYHDSIVLRKRSEGRLKLFDSCTDPRAWSPNSLDNFRYFREFVENPLPQGKIVPYDVMIETLIQLGAQTQTELVSLRRQLEKYKSLRLSTEQQEQLQDINDFSLEETKEIANLEALQKFKSIREETRIPERPRTPEHSISSSSSNYESESVHRSKIDDESVSDYPIGAKKTIASSKTDSNKYQDISDVENCLRANEFNQEIIIGKDSEIIALKNELGAKDAELEELKDFNRRLETKLEKKEAMLVSLRENFRIGQQQITNLIDQRNQEIEEWKKKFHSSKNLVDHLRNSLSEISQECTARTLEITKLYKQIEDNKIIKQERDYLAITLNDMEKKRNRLIDVNREQSTNLLDQEEEIKRLLNELKLKAVESEDREIKLKRIIDELRNEMQTKDNPSFVNDERVASWRQIENCPSISEMTNLNIRKMRHALQENLNDLNNEMRRRLSEVQHNHRFREDKMNSKATCCDKELDEYSNEQLKTMQVPASRKTNEEQPYDENYKRVASQTSDFTEKRQQLQFDGLELCQQQRRTCLCQDKRDRDEKVIPVTKKINGPIDSEEKKMSEGSEREEKDRLDTKELDEKIDDALVIHVMRSIERVERISLDLEGAGDNVSREMARKEEELKAKNEEIANLRVEVASRIPRGQGDHPAQYEHSNELSMTQRSLQRTREQLQSREFQLKGANDMIKKLGIDINRLTKEHKGLNNTVQIIHDLTIKVDEMDVKLNSLQEENSKLRERVSEANKLCAEYQNKLLKFEDLKMKDKESLERTELRLESMMRERDTKIDQLQGERMTERRALEEANLQIATLTKQIQTLKSKNKNFTLLEDLVKEIETLHKKEKSLRVKRESLKSQQAKQLHENDNIEEQLNSMHRENESLKYKRKELIENIERNRSDSRMPDTLAKQVLDTLPNKVLGHIESLKTQLSSSKLVDLALQSEINELKTKLEEDASTIEDLRRNIDSWNIKVVEQEKRIIILEEEKVELRMRNEKIRILSESVEQESMPGIFTQEIIAEQVKHLKAEITDKDERIEILAREIEATKTECKALSDKVKLLTNEKIELAEKVTNEKKTCERKIAELQQQYHQRVRALHDQHNVSVKRLEAQYMEAMKNNGNAFDPEIWLQSLTIKEMTELQNRISTPSDTSKITRSLNDKENQQLQEGEILLLYDIVKKGQYKATPSSRTSYVYAARRDVDKPTETPVKDNATFDDEQQMKFILGCATKHNLDDIN